MSPAWQSARQRGSVAFTVVLALVCLVGAATIAVVARSAADAAERERRTAEALALAKQALIGFAIRGTPTAQGRPGDLPCPDLNNDGSADPVPGCAAPGARIGRLPWRTLGLPDLRDGYGERLWYAVSVNYKDNPRSTCPAPGAAGCLNSDTAGTITVRTAEGAIVNDGAALARGAAGPPTGAIAVVISAGPVLIRLDRATPQDRSCMRGNVPDPACTERDGLCSGTMPSAYLQTARCNPVNYLDIAGPPVRSVPGATAATEDNVTFVDGSAADGFISGDIVDASGRTVVNDRVLALTYAELMPLLEQRVAREVLNCLTGYAAANDGKYPYAAKADDVGDFADQPGRRFGRIPDQRFARTRLANSRLADEWTDTCALKVKHTPPAASTSPAWWTNWKDLVFFGYAANLDPDPAVDESQCNPLTSCLAVNPPSPARDKNLVVLLARRSLAGQVRATPTAPIAPLTQYLEDANAIADPLFTLAAPSGSFNDLVLWQ